MTTASHDRSTRHIQPESPYVANLAALWTADPALARSIEQLPEGSESILVEPSRKGPPTLGLVLSGRTVYLHSRHDPVEEARRLCHEVDTNDKLLWFVHGLGLGYHVSELLGRLSDEASVFVFEPRAEVIRAALAARDFSKPIGAGQLHLIHASDKAELFARLMPHAASASIGVGMLKHAPSVATGPREFAEFDQLVADFLAYARTCVSTLVLNGRRTAQNIINNLPWYVASPGLGRLEGAFAGKPAIIVSAGPSLRKNKHLLPAAADKAVMIAVQTTLKPLLELGVVPHFVTSLDYHDICTRFFEGLPEGLTTELVAEPKATNAIFDLHPGPISLLGNDFAESLLPELQLGKPRLPAGATVAHLAFYLAQHLGCDPIIFVGQDLGFSDGLCYAPGTSYEDVWRPELGPFCTLEMKQWEQIVRDRVILRRVSDYAGRPTYTEERLFTYLQHFERDFAKSPARIIDATEGGVRKRGAEPMPLASAIEAFCTQRLDASPPPHSGLDFGRIDAAAELLSLRVEEVSTIQAISEETLPLLQEIADHIDDQPRVNRAIGRIDQLRAKLEPLGRTYHLVTQLTQQTELRRFAADRRIAAAQVDPSERQRRQVARDIENVGAIGRAAGELRDDLKTAIERLKRHAGLCRRSAA